MTMTKDERITRANEIFDHVFGSDHASQVDQQLHDIDREIHKIDCLHDELEAWSLETSSLTGPKRMGQLDLSDIHEIISGSVAKAKTAIEELRKLQEGQR